MNGQRNTVMHFLTRKIRYILICPLRYVLLLSFMSNLVMSEVVAKELDKARFVEDIEHAKLVARQGGLSKAIQFWESKEEDYGHAGGHYEYELGTFYLTAKRYTDAEKVFKDAIASISGYPRLYTGLSITYLGMDKVEDARHWANRAIVEYPNWWMGYSVTANIEYHVDNYEKAKELSKKSLRIEVTPQAFYMLSISSWELGHFEDVVQGMEAAINLDNSYLGNKEGMMVTVNALYKLGRYEDALAALETLANNSNIKRSDIEAFGEEIRLKMANEH